MVHSWNLEKIKSRKESKRCISCFLWLCLLNIQSIDDMKPTVVVSFDSSTTPIVMMRMIWRHGLGWDSLRSSLRRIWWLCRRPSSKIGWIDRIQVWILDHRSLIICTGWWWCWCWWCWWWWWAIEVHTNVIETWISRWNVHGACWKSSLGHQTKSRELIMKVTLSLLLLSSKKKEEEKKKHPGEGDWPAKLAPSTSLPNEFPSQNFSFQRINI